MAEWSAWIVEYNNCEVQLAASLLEGHLLLQHGVTQAAAVGITEMEEREV